MSQYAETVKRLPGEVASQPCRQCQELTSVTMLGQYGARCFRCFEDFCGAAFSPTPGAYDTVQQAEMRKHLKRDRPTGQAMAAPEDDAAKRDRAKAAMARRVAEYQQRTGAR